MTFDARLRPYRPVIWMFAVFLLLQAVTAAVLFVQKLGVTPESIARFYVGHEESFAQPKTFSGLIKVTVPHLLAIPLTVFITVHLVGYVGVVRRRPFLFASRLVFGFTAFSLAIGYAIRFVSPQLAFAKLVAFVGLEAMLLFWLALLVSAFWPGRLARAVEDQLSDVPPRGWLHERMSWRR